MRKACSEQQTMFSLAECGQVVVLVLILVSPPFDLTSASDGIAHTAIRNFANVVLQEPDIRL